MASLVCSVVRTKCPVRAAQNRLSQPSSWSRISPQHNNVRILSQNSAQSSGKRHASRFMDLGLRNAGQHVLDGIFDRDNIHVARWRSPASWYTSVLVLPEPVGTCKKSPCLAVARASLYRLPAPFSEKPNSLMLENGFWRGSKTDHGFLATDTGQACSPAYPSPNFSIRF